MMRNFWLMWILVFASLMSCRSMLAEHVVWARGAVHFGHECKPPAESCRLAYVVSPNHQYAISVERTKDNLSVDVIRGTDRFPVALADEMDAETEWFVQMEIFWAPDSSAVSLAWNTSAITNSTRIYAVGPKGAESVNLSALREGFVRKWPPCVVSEGPCTISSRGEDYNYLTVAWAYPHTVVMMAEVPPSSMYGNNMGKVIGYEFDTKTGKLMRTMGPLEFKRCWQSRMGWKFDLASAGAL